MATDNGDPSAADASRSFRAPLLVMALLTITAGFADGHSLTRSDVFVANQSGNVVRFGMGLVGEYGAWPLALLSMVGFAVGSMLTWSLGGLARTRSWPLIRLRVIAVSVLIAAWWVALLVLGEDGGRISAFIGAAAMGVLASIITKVAGVQAQTTFQTATVARSADGLLQWLTHADPVHHSGRRLALLGALTLACYAGGGALGAVTARMGPGALLLLLVPLAIALVLAHRRDVDEGANADGSAHT